jgi:dihydropteroate synthase
MKWNCAHWEWTDSAGPLVMGILNLTPDSFSDGGAYADVAAALRAAEKMKEDGADIVDVGGESTRPGATVVSEEEERRRVIPVIEQLQRLGLGPISVDTRKASVARAALEAGACIINDVSGCDDPQMPALLAAARCGYVLMHTQGTPQTMQNNPVYGDVVGDVFLFLQRRMEALREAGVAPERLAVDPGFGFGKTWQHNRSLLLGLKRFTELGRPVLVGLSRKSFVGTVTGTPQMDRLGGSLAVETLALWNGATLVRTHAVHETKQAAQMVAQLTRSTG